MKYDFDTVTDRRNTFSMKYDPEAFGKPRDVIPMWIADMDFQAPPCVLTALEEQVRHGIFGYSMPDKGFFDALSRWHELRFGWNTEREWLINTQGIVNAIYIGIRALTEPGDGILVQQPVYFPFMAAVANTGRKLLVNNLVKKDGRYIIDFSDFEEKIKQAKLFILCSPHNPVGRVWTHEELARMGEICLRHGVTVIADEIHQDFVFPGNRHYIFASLDRELSDITITCTAPSKSFNVAGLPLSNIFIQNRDMRDKFKAEYESCGLGGAGVLSIVACKAAYEGAEEWLDELILYLNGNMDLIQEFLRERLPDIRFTKPEGTYLAWLDFSGLGYGDDELDEIITNKARLWLSFGSSFGEGGAGFRRMNTACPRTVLRESLLRLETAFRV